MAISRTSTQSVHILPVFLSREGTQPDPTLTTRLLECYTITCSYVTVGPRGVLTKKATEGILILVFWLST